jgi:hypothetical protein
VAWLAVGEVGVTRIAVLVELGSGLYCAASLALLLYLGSVGGVAVADVVRPSYQFQVFKSIVEFVSVPVVDNFVIGQGSPKVLLHHIAVFKDRAALDGDHSIAVAGPREAALVVVVIGSTIHFRAARQRAVLLIAGCQPELALAVSAEVRALLRFPVARMTTVLLLGLPGAEC